MKGKRKREITFYEIDKDWQLLLDPENIFWGSFQEKMGSLLSLKGCLIFTIRKEITLTRRCMNTDSMSHLIVCI